LPTTTTTPRSHHTPTTPHTTYLTTYSATCLVWPATRPLPPHHHCTARPRTTRPTLQPHTTHTTTDVPHGYTHTHTAYTYILHAHYTAHHTATHTYTLPTRSGPPPYRSRTAARAVPTSLRIVLFAGLLRDTSCRGFLFLLMDHRLPAFCMDARTLSLRGLYRTALPAPARLLLSAHLFCPHPQFFAAPAAHCARIPVLRRWTCTCRAPTCSVFPPRSSTPR